MTQLRRWIAQPQRSRVRAAVLTASLLGTLAVSAMAWQARRAAAANQRQQAIDSALVVALTGDLKATDEAISRAEQAGVSAEWLGLLRGQVAYHRGEYAAAIQHLESAAQSSRPTVAAVALQASAQLAAGSWENYEALLERAGSLTPTTAEDFLFQGAAEIYFDPSKAVRSLTAAVQQRDTPLARLVRAEARANLAFDTNELPTAEAALSDAFIARDLLPDHPAALLESLNAHTVAAELWSDSGRMDRRDDELAAAEKTFRALDAFQHLPTVIHNRALFLLLTNRESSAFDLLQVAEAQHGDPVVAYDFALALFRRGDSHAALRILKTRAAGKSSRAATFQTLTADEAFLRVWLLQEIGDTMAARSSYEELVQRYQTGLTAYFRPCVLLLLGDFDAATAESRRLQTVSQSPRLRGAFYSRLLAFNSGQMSEPELLDSVSGSRWDRCESLFFAGLRRLASGDRAAAKQLLERCVATRCAGFLSWDWSHTILRRWDADLQWPSWIK